MSTLKPSNSTPLKMIVIDLTNSKQNLNMTPQSSDIRKIISRTMEFVSGSGDSGIF